MVKVFRKISIGALSVLAVIGLTGCSTEGLSKNQVETMMTTVEQTQTFMGDVTTALNNQIREDKKYIFELSTQNELKQAEIDEITRQNDLKEQELEEQKRVKSISAEEAKALLTKAIINFETNDSNIADNVKLTGRLSGYSFSAGELDYQSEYETFEEECVILQKLVVSDESENLYYITQGDDYCQIVKTINEKDFVFYRQGENISESIRIHSKFNDIRAVFIGMMTFVYNNSFEASVLADGSILLQISKANSLESEPESNYIDFSDDAWQTVCNSVLLDNTGRIVRVENKEMIQYGNSTESFNYEYTFEYGVVTDEQVLAIYNEEIGGDGFVGLKLYTAINQALEDENITKVNLSGQVNASYNTIEELFTARQGLKAAFYEFDEIKVVSNEEGVLKIEVARDGNGNADEYRSAVITIKDGVLYGEDDKPYGEKCIVITRFDSKVVNIKFTYSQESGD